MITKTNLASLLNVSDEDLRLIAENAALAQALSLKVAETCRRFRRSSALDPDVLEEDVQLYLGRRFDELDIPKPIKTRVVDRIPWIMVDKDDSPKQSKRWRVKDFLAQFPTSYEISRVKNWGREAQAAIIKALEPAGFPQ